MLVEFTALPNRKVFFIAAETVQRITRADDNPLITMVVTTLMGPQGYQAFQIAENPEEAARRVNAALGGAPQFKLQ